MGLEGDMGFNGIGSIQDVGMRAPRALVEQAGTPHGQGRPELAGTQMPAHLLARQSDAFYISDEALQTMGRRPPTEVVEDVEPLKQMLRSLMQDNLRGREEQVVPTDAAQTVVSSGQPRKDESSQPRLAVSIASTPDGFQSTGEAEASNAAPRRKGEWTSDRLAALMTLARAEISGERGCQSPALSQLDDLLGR